MTEKEDIALLREALKASFKEACNWHDDSVGGAPKDLDCFEIVTRALEETE